MARAIWFVVSIVTALAMALVLVIGVELFSAVVHPLPEDFDNTTEQMCRHVENYPAWVLAVVVPLWAGIALVSTWVAGRLGHWSSALLIAVFLIASVAFNAAMLPYPVWFKAVCPAAVALAAAWSVYNSNRGNVPAPA